jgi:hypothetical protein
MDGRSVVRAWFNRFECVSIFSSYLSWNFNWNFYKNGHFIHKDMIVQEMYILNHYADGNSKNSRTLELCSKCFIMSRGQMAPYSLRLVCYSSSFENALLHPLLQESV